MVEKTTEQKFKEIIIDMNRGYPGYIYYPKNFEEKFNENYLKVIDTLKKDKIIIEGIDSENNIGYRLSGRGMDVANSIITGIFTKETHDFTEKLLLLAGITVILVIAQLVPTLTITSMLLAILLLLSRKLKYKIARN